MGPKIFGIEHILYLVATFIIFAILIFLMHYLFKKDINKKTLIFRIIGLIGLISVLSNRIAVAFILRGNPLLLIPDSLCGISSLMISISLLFFKEDNKLLQIFWLLALIGDLATLIYPDFIGQDKSLFYLPTISGLWHHSWTFFAVITVLIFKYINLDIRKSWYQIFGFLFLIILGYFLIYVGKLEDAFNLSKPLLSGTPLYFWILLPIYLVIYFFILIICEIIKKKKKIH